MSEMKLSSAAEPVGYVKITLDYGDRKEVFYQESEKNIFTRASRLRLLQSLYVDGQVSDPIKTLKVGVGGSIDPDGLYPKVASISQTDLNDVVLEITATKSINEANLSVTYLADVDKSQCNGMLINEVGLFTELGMLSNVKNFVRIPKTADFAIHFEWTLRLL